jgi:REP element-mobilizing transposase RayT
LYKLREFRTRKPNRLRNYDYSQRGAYFVTVCAKDRHELFGNVIVGAVANRPSYVELSRIGKTVEDEIKVLQEVRKNIVIDRYVVMPNHIHMIIVLVDCRWFPVDNGRLTTAPTTTSLSNIVRLWKRSVSIQIGFSPWQKSFHDHIIRNEDDYRNIAEYIDSNPARWTEDCFYPEQSPVPETRPTYRGS